MKYGVLKLLFFITCFGIAQNSDDLKLFDNIQELSAENIFKTPGYYNWGSSTIKGKDGKYHLFYARWKKDYKFTGWLTHSEIAHATSKSPNGPWKFKETVLKGNGAGNWDAITAHNPKIKFFEGKYYLYYIATNLGDKKYTDEELIETAQAGYSHPNWKILRPNQRTGVAVSNSINGPWKRLEQPLVEPKGPITTLTVNPAISKGKDGNYYLIIKGDKPNETRFIRNQAIAVSDSPVGPFKIQDRPVIDDLDTEDMSMWYDEKRDRFYGIFHAHGFIGLVTSSDGIEWKRSDEYIVMTKELKHSDGSVIKPSRLERPFVFVENGKPKTLSLAVKDGDNSYNVHLPIKENPYPVPNKRQLAWQEAELGVVFHYDVHVFDKKKYNQQENRITPNLNYQMFNPEKLDTDQWVKAAKDAGATFALLTASHETGFALFQSKVNPYSLRALDWRNGQGDIVRDFVNSCRKYGIKPGIYIGLRWNSLFGVHDFKVDGTDIFGDNRQQWYKQMVEGMVKEICTNYGELFELWFDGGAHHPDFGAPDLLPIARKYQPNALFYHNGQLAEARWGGSESGTVSYPSWSTFKYKATGAGETEKKEIYKNGFKMLKEGVADGNYWMPAMSDAPLRGYNGRHEWFWEPGDEAHIYPLKSLMNMYYKSVGRNSTLIMGLTPDDTGLLPKEDVERLKEWGDEIKRVFSNKVGETSGEGYKYSIKFKKPTAINHIVIQEDIQYGERVRKYVLKGLVNGKWTLLSEGQSVGHKRIEKIQNVKITKLSLEITTATRKPLIKNFSAFFATE